MKLPEWANWLTRDEDGDLYAFENKPIKSIGDGEWFEFGCGRLKEVEETDDTFETVKWEDEYPTVVDKDHNTFKWSEKPDLLPTMETLDEVFGSKSDDVSSLPNWVNWLARDEDGELWAYSEKPHKEGDMWDCDDYPEVKREIEDNVSEIYNIIQWTDKEPTKVIRGRETSGISATELNRIISAKAHGYDSVPEMEERPKEGGKTMSEKQRYFIDQPIIETYRGAGVYLGNGPREDDTSTAFVRLESGEILITSPEYIERTNTFTCSQVMAGLEQNYFKEGTRFRVNAETIFEVALAGSDKLGLRRDNVSDTICINLYCSYIHETWTLISEGPKEMTLSEIEEALGHRVKIKEEL